MIKMLWTHSCILSWRYVIINWQTVKGSTSFHFICMSQFNSFLVFNYFITVTVHQWFLRAATVYTWAAICVWIGNHINVWAVPNIKIQATLKRCQVPSLGYWLCMWNEVVYLFMHSIMRSPLSREKTNGQWGQIIELCNCASVTDELCQSPGQGGANSP